MRSASSISRSAHSRCRGARLAGRCATRAWTSRKFSRLASEHREVRRLGDATRAALLARTPRTCRAWRRGRRPAVEEPVEQRPGQLPARRGRPEVVPVDDDQRAGRVGEDVLRVQVAVAHDQLGRDRPGATAAHSSGSVASRSASRAGPHRVRRGHPAHSCAAGTRSYQGSGGPPPSSTAAAGAHRCRRASSARAPPAWPARPARPAAGRPSRRGAATSRRAP